MNNRWPGWVYVEGDEPDYRFSFANERTFLAWIRTSLALLAAGVALDVVSLSISPSVQRALAILLVTLGMGCAALGWVRWAISERALRQSGPLPSFSFGAVLALAMVVSVLTFVVAGL